MSFQLLHGDCLDLMAGIATGSVDMILCDLPYGQTNCKWDSVIPFEPLWAQYKRIAKPNAAIVLTASQPFTSALVMSNAKEFKHEWVWDKRTATGALNANRMPLKAHEVALVFCRGFLTYYPQKTQRTEKELSRFAKSDRFTPMAAGIYGATKASNWPTRADREWRHPTSVIRIGGMNGHHIERTGHPTQKPVALMEYLIRTYTNEGETVMDNCFGSGTTGVACVNTGRNFIGMEKDAAYFEIARQRIETAQLPLLQVA